MNAESGFEKIIQYLNSKSLYVKEFEKKIDGMIHDIHLLKTALASFEVCPLFPSLIINKCFLLFLY